MTSTVGIMFPRFLLDNLLNMYEKLTLNIMYNACKKKILKYYCKHSLIK